MVKHLLTKISSTIWQLPLSYIGLSKKFEIHPFIINVIIGPIWETIVFQGILFGIPLSIVRKSWDIAWLPDPQFDRLLKWVIIILSALISNFIFVTFHRPGHFGTLFMEVSAKRLLKKMERAWLWENYEVARNCASELLPVAEEWWVREGWDYPQFLQALSLHVLSRGNGITPQQRQRMERILSEIKIFPNDILQA